MGTGILKKHNFVAAAVILLAVLLNAALFAYLLKLDYGRIRAVLRVGILRG